MSSPASATPLQSSASAPSGKSTSFALARASLADEQMHSDVLSFLVNKSYPHLTKDGWMDGWIDR